MGCGRGVWPWGLGWARRTDVRRGAEHEHLRGARLRPAQPVLASAVVAQGPRHQGVRVAEEHLGTRAARGGTRRSARRISHTPRRSHLAAHTTLDLPQPGAAAPEQSSRAVPPCRCRGGSAAPQPPPRYRRRPAGAAAARGSRGSTCAPARVAGHRVRARPPPRGAGPRGAGSVAPVPPPMPSRSSAHSPAAASCYLPPAAACDRPAPRRRPPR